MITEDEFRSIGYVFIHTKGPYGLWIKKGCADLRYYVEGVWSDDNRIEGWYRDRLVFGGVCDSLEDLMLLAAGFVPKLGDVRRVLQRDVEVDNKVLMTIEEILERYPLSKEEEMALRVIIGGKK